MINSERIPAARLPARPDGGGGLELELIGSDRAGAPYALPCLEIADGHAAHRFRFRSAPRLRRPRGVRAEFAEYARDAAPHGAGRGRAAVLPLTPAAGGGRLDAAVKRSLDIVGALALLLVFAPVTVSVALLVRCTSRGPVLFRQPRLGENGQVFLCLKFRTMVQDAEQQLREESHLRAQYAADFKIKDDPRVTRVGRLLRKTSLDELPQLWNVLQGAMSLVGPRPIVPPEIDKYGRYGDKLLTVRPGLTGVWQVCGRSDTSYDERILMDMFYVDRRTVAMDVKLLCSTVVSVLRCRGAY